MTGAFGLDDPTIARRRCDADLAVLKEYLHRYAGMKQACVEQLTWGPERYAQLPPGPTLHDLRSESKGPGFLAISAALLAYVFVGMPAWKMIMVTGLSFMKATEMNEVAEYLAGIVLLLVALLGILAPPILAYVLISDLVWRHQTKARRDENARREHDYREALARSLRDAEPRKAAEDHRLRLHIRELESLAKTVAEKEAVIRQLRSTL